jgi:5-formyltetrahydrofolate cyclo-ligase
MSVEAGKAALRASLLSARVTDADEDRQRCRALLAIPEIAGARVVAGYSALRGEPDIGGALDALRERGVVVLLPKMLADRDLEFRVDGRDGVMPIEEADVLLVPAVAADRTGRRLGRGGGSYDRALPRVRPGALVVAIVHAEELLASVPVEAHDVTMGAVLAGAELIRVGS